MDLIHRMDCLSTCLINDYPQSNADCGDCQASCLNGCVKGTDCYLCYDYHCTDCTDFDSGSCATCDSLTSSSGGACTCSATDWKGDIYERTITRNRAVLTIVPHAPMVLSFKSTVLLVSPTHKSNLLY